LGQGSLSESHVAVGCESVAACRVAACFIAINACDSVAANLVTGVDANSCAVLACGVDAQSSIEDRWEVGVCIAGSEGGEVDGGEAPHAASLGPSALGVAVAWAWYIGGLDASH
jgi:hypothetical protein